MQNIQKQISRLYLSTVFGYLSLSGAWIAILAVRGYSLVEIGFAETVFHITSLILEIPSGVFADVFGRKNMLIVSSIMRTIGNIVMIFSSNFWMICISMMFQAANYNFSSGSGEALAYDSLKLAGQEARYEKYASNQLVIQRFCRGLSTLCAGFALFIGYQMAYGADLLIGMIQIWMLGSLYEAGTGRKHENNEQSPLAQSEAKLRNLQIILHNIGRELVSCFITSLSFMKKAKGAVLLMFCNSLVGAADILLLYFLQAKLPESGMSDSALGFALFFMELGGIFGAKIILKCKQLQYRSVFVITGLLVFCGILAEHSGLCILMTAGGFAAALGDDALQVRTNTVLQDMFPSDQRATLISIESFIFSMIMIVLSPLAGGWFSRW